MGMSAEIAVDQMVFRKTHEHAGRSLDHPREQLDEAFVLRTDYPEFLQAG
jgi:hypothetical protein